MSCKRDRRRARSSGKAKDVGQQVLHEYDAAGADHGNFEHDGSFLEWNPIGCLT